MLLETIKRYNAKSIKCVSIDMLRAVGKNIPQIHSVPALVTLPNKNILFGKAVFDYLLLPKTGKLVSGQLPSEQGNPNNPNSSGATNSGEDPSEPMSFSIGSSFSDNFAMIEDITLTSDNGLNDRVYGWSSLNPDDMDKLKPELADISQETRTRKEPLDLNELNARRAIELEQNDLNTNQLPPPTTSR
jgi:hypothetical protein